MDVCRVQSSSPTGNEQVGRDIPTSPVTIASHNIVSEHLAGRSVQWQESVFAKLGTADRQYAFCQIHIPKLKIERLGQTHARHAQQTEQAIKGHRAQCTSFVAVLDLEGGMH